MRKAIIIFLGLIISAGIYAQQFPFMEGYNINTFILSPSYAGIKNTKTLFIDYRSDWSGITGGPVTCQLSYNDRVHEKVGLGVRFIYDKTDIFKQVLVLGTYTYEVHVAEEQNINFGLSLGLYKNSIDLAKYFNDPAYVQDNALIYGRVKSKTKLTTEMSVLYRLKKAEAGIVFSNVMFGTVRYRITDMRYKPLKNYLLHLAYNFKLDGSWSAKPTILLRGGQNIPAQMEISSSMTWNNHFWGTLLYRTGGIIGIGLGGEVYNGLIVNYSHNMSNSVLMNTFGSNQLSLGIKLFKNKKRQSPEN